ncbi:unnamed protein product [Allacma fusca]|uniref:Uncharacterized protein n=1 Tax=Allacma fusca TaxID=39272 RepID=A0A8J2JW17_9HEXA|nr:unnamed protein product [Allacma fusca]
MQNEVDREGGCNESNWRRKGDVSRNLPELKKRLLSRNRIYVVPDESSNGHGTSKLAVVGGLNSARSSETSPEISRFHSTFCSPPPPPPPTPLGPERKQGNFKDRARKLIAPSKDERASSLDLWDGSSLYTGTVKRRPAATKRALSLENSSQFNLKFTHQQQQGRNKDSPTYFHQPSSSSCSQVRPPPIPTLTTCPNENSHIERIMGNTFTSSGCKPKGSNGKPVAAGIVGVGSKSRNCANPNALSHYPFLNIGRKSFLKRSTNERKKCDEANECGKDTLTLSNNAGATPNSGLIANGPSTQKLSSDANDLRSSPAHSFRSSSPDSLPPISILNDFSENEETFEFQLEHQTRTSSCHLKKTLGISHSQIECDNLVRRIGDSSYVSPRKSNFRVGKCGNLPQNDDEMSQVEHLYSQDDDQPHCNNNRTVGTVAWERLPANQFNVSPSPSTPSSTNSRAQCVSEDLLEFSKCDRQVILRQNDISCHTISPSCTQPPNEQLEREQLDLSSLEPSTLPLDLSRNESLDNSRNESRVENQGRVNTSLHPSRPHYGSNSNDSGCKSQMDDSHYSIVSADRLITTSVMCPVNCVEKCVMENMRHYQNETTGNSTRANSGVAGILLKSRTNPINYVKVIDVPCFSL